MTRQIGICLAIVTLLFAGPSKALSPVSIPAEYASNAQISGQLDRLLELQTSIPAKACNLHECRFPIAPLLLSVTVPGRPGIQVRFFQAVFYHGLDSNDQPAPVLLRGEA